MLTIAEYLAVTQPEIVVALESRAGPAFEGSEQNASVENGEEKRQVDVTSRLFEDDDLDPKIEKLMRHDAYRRGLGGALRQVRHA